MATDTQAAPVVLIDDLPMMRAFECPLCGYEDDAVTCTSCGERICTECATVDGETQEWFCLPCHDEHEGRLAALAEAHGRRIDEAYALRVDAQMGVL